VTEAEEHDSLPHESLEASGSSTQSSKSPQPICCPNCGSTKLYRDGLRYLSDGTIVQRWLCRNCGYRFTDPNHKAKTGWRNLPSGLNLPFGLLYSCQGNDDPVGRVPSARKAVQTLATVEKQNEKRAAGATETNTMATLILDYAWNVKKRGLAEQTIKQRVCRLKQLVKRGANLLDPDSVLTVLATSNWTDSNKRVFIVAYKSFAKTFNIAFEPPKTRVERKLPFIPTEEELDQLIAGCGKKTATFLQVLKATGARTAEALKLKWIDIDEKSCIIRINNPVKGSLARAIKVSAETIAMINALPKTSEYVFNTNQYTLRANFYDQRKKIASKLQNPRLLQIRLHTFRHWKATMEYHKTKNIKWVQQLLGHKKLENTDFYTQLINFESDEYHVAYAKNLEEESKLIEAGFEYVRYSEKDGVAIYRKRK